MTAASDNQTLVPDANLVPGGANGARTLTITPAPNQNGTRHHHRHGDATPAASPPPTPSCSPSPPSTTRPRSPSAGNPPAVLEDAGAQTVSELRHRDQRRARERGAGQADLIGFTLTPTGTTGGLTFSDRPGDRRDGHADLHGGGDANGTATYSVTLTDSGSRHQRHTAPADLHHHRHRGQRRAELHQGRPTRRSTRTPGRRRSTGWATAHLRRPAERERTQTLSLRRRRATTTPACSPPGRRSRPTGTLTYTPAPNQHGVATITLLLRTTAAPPTAA